MRWLLYKKQAEIRCVCSPAKECEKWVYSGAKTCKCRKCATFALGCSLEPVNCNRFEKRIDGQFYSPSDNDKRFYPSFNDKFFNGKACQSFIEFFFRYHQNCTPFENVLIGNILTSLWRFKGAG